MALPAAGSRAGGNESEGRRYRRLQPVIRDTRFIDRRSNVASLDRERTRRIQRWSAIDLAASNWGARKSPIAVVAAAAVLVFQQRLRSADLPPSPRSGRAFRAGAPRRLSSSPPERPGARGAIHIARCRLPRNPSANGTYASRPSPRNQLSTLRSSNRCRRSRYHRLPGSSRSPGVQRYRTHRSRPNRSRTCEPLARRDQRANSMSTASRRVLFRRQPARPGRSCPG